jgi:hypothetical protein
MKRICFLMILSITFSDVYSQIHRVEFLSELKKSNFPIEMITKYTTLEITFDDFEERMVDNYCFNEFTYQYDTISEKFHYLDLKMSIGELDFFPIFYVVTKGDSIQNIFAQNVVFSFLSLIKDINHFETKFSQKEVIKEIFNSTELTILEVNDQYLSGFCFDSVANSNGYFIIDFAIWSTPKDILNRSDFKFIEIDDDIDWIKNFEPLIYLKTSESFLSTYGTIKDEPEVIRYREVYYDINSGKIIKDQLSSEFIYYFIDRH